jgi:DNA (cytosine-5)-methyltransferase 1
MDKSRNELIAICKERGIKGYSKKTKEELVQMLFTSPIKFIDLFCGIGGFHQALHRMGGQCVLACDIDDKCREIYHQNYGITPHDDVTTIDTNTMPDFDVLCAGFPCQPFSNGGNKRSFDDKRGRLFDEIIRIAVAKKPRFMFLENVKHIKKVSDGRVYEYILEELNKSNYHVNVVEISPHQLGIPQQRERVIFICIRKDIYDDKKDISIDLPDSTECNVESIIEENAPEKYNIPEQTNTLLEAWDEMVKHVEVGQSLSPTILCKEFKTTYTPEEFAELPKWKQEYITKNKPLYEKYKDKWDSWFETHKDILSANEVNSKLEWQAGHKVEGDSIFNHFIQLRQSGIRVKKAKYFPTLVAIVQIPIYGKKKRYLTPRECARLQSFPDSFQLHPNDKIAYKQFGNAVNVEVVHHVMNKVLDAYGVLTN